MSAHCRCDLPGKTVTFARTVDIPRSAYNFRFFASSALHHLSECSQMEHAGVLNYTLRCPVGVGESSAPSSGTLRYSPPPPPGLLHVFVFCVGSRSDQPLEPPPLPAHLEDRARHRGGEHGGGQAQRDDLGDRLDAVQADGAGR